MSASRFTVTIGPAICMNRTSASLHSLKKTTEFFVGIDSDGCAFDTMVLKHKECFIPSFIQHFGLEEISEITRETAEFVNLHSIWRGTNRFPGYLKTLEFLAARPEVLTKEFRVPQLPGLRNWVKRETRLGNPALEAEVELTGDPDLVLTLAWSLEVNRLIAQNVKHVPPFPLVRESLEELQGRADIVVISATPTEALEREWQEHDLAKWVGLIAGQEFGSKAEILQLATAGKYEKNHVLMVGDAPGDLKAAESNGALFYPIMPGGEEASWAGLYEEAMPAFLEGRYQGRFMNDEIQRFKAALPERPPW